MKDTKKNTGGLTNAFKITKGKLLICLVAILVLAVFVFVSGYCTDFRSFHENYGDKSRFRCSADFFLSLSTYGNYLFWPINLAGEILPIEALPVNLLRVVVLAFFLLVIFFLSSLHLYFISLVCKPPAQRTKKVVLFIFAIGIYLTIGVIFS